MRKHCSLAVLENFFEPCTLLLLAQSPSYGYELQRKLTQDCHCSVNIGNLYRSLARMRLAGYIKQKKHESTLGPARMMYAITPKGKVHLAAWATALNHTHQSLSKFITNYSQIT